MRKAKRIFLMIYPAFHVFAISFTVLFLCWQEFSIEPLQPTIARVVETVAPNLIEFLTGGNALAPTDFVFNHKH